MSERLERLLEEEAKPFDYDWVMHFARQAHELAGQPGYFDDHVMKVYHKAESYNISEVTRVAALLHDVLEDTSVTFDQLRERFGPTVSQIVWALTDEPGQDRNERKAKTYWKIRSDQNATLIKLCDRWENVSRCILNGSPRHTAMYISEYYTFKCALWEPSHFQSLWAELDYLHERMLVRLAGARETGGNIARHTH